MCAKCCKSRACRVGSDKFQDIFSSCHSYTSFSTCPIAWCSMSDLFYGYQYKTGLSYLKSTEKVTTYKTLLHKSFKINVISSKLYNVQLCMYSVQKTVHTFGTYSVMIGTSSNKNSPLRTVNILLNFSKKTRELF